jgi:hypothetical protein
MIGRGTRFMAFQQAQYKGFVIGSLNKKKPCSKQEAYAFAMTVWGGRVSKELLDLWVTGWWQQRSEAGPVVATGKATAKATPTRQITLEDLDTADTFDRYVRMYSITPQHMRTIIECINQLRGLDFALEVVAALRRLRESPIDYRDFSET